MFLPRVIQSLFLFLFLSSTKGVGVDSKIVDFRTVARSEEWFTVELELE
jgi:hypothetical protein